MFLSVGPIINLTCHQKRVGGYLRGSPGSQDKACLHQFLADVQGATIQVPYKIVGNQFLLGVCNHVLYVKFNNTGDDMKITNMRPGIL